MKTGVMYQRLEAAVLLIGLVFIYLHLQYSLLWFMGLLFTIDVFAFGYLINAKVGAHMYNIGHSYLIPTFLGVIGFIGGTRAVTGLAIIWFAHIAMDRAFGFGLKYTSGFKDTHLGHLGKE